MWDPFKIKHINSIEQVFKRFSRRIERMEDLDYWSRLKELGVMSLQRRREKLIIILLWKIKNNMIQNDIGIEFKFNERNSQIKAVIKPMAKLRGRVQSSFEQSFIIKSAKIWNKLPPKLTEISLLNSFKTKLDKYLSFIPDEPPVNGYFHKTKNSILDYKVVKYEAVFRS